MDLEFIMDTALATIIASVIALAGVFLKDMLSNRKGYKDITNKIGNPDGKTLVCFIDDKLGKLDNTTLSGQHEQIKDFINQKVGSLEDTTLSAQNKTIIKEVKTIKDEIITAQTEEFSKRQQLTGDQARIDQSIVILSAFNQKMIDVQYENSVLRQEIKELKLENQELKQQVELLEQEQDENYDEEPKLKLK